jgi:hypothetical protein
MAWGLFYGNSPGNPELSWIDVPKDDLRLILYEYDTVLDHSNALIKKYHQIPKNDFRNIDQRVKLLRTITDSLENVEMCTKSGYIKNVAKTLKSISLN